MTRLKCNGDESILLGCDVNVVIYFLIKKKTRKIEDLTSMLLYY